MSENETQTYKIKSTKLAYLQERFKRIALRARRCGCPAPSFKIVATEDIKVEKHINRVHTIELVGEAPIIAGYRFLGTLEHNHEIGIIVRAVPGRAIPAQYRSADPSNCDHCHKNIITRKETFIVEHIESGICKQVGRTCIADFLGGVDPKWVLYLTELLSQAGEILDFSEKDEDEYGGGDSAPYLFDTADVLALTSALCRNIGWVPRSKASMMHIPTADLAKGWFTARDRKELFKNPRTGVIDYEEMAKYDVTERDTEIALAAIEWARELPNTVDDLSDYLYNLSMIAKAGVLETKHFGIACSIIPAYNREQERLLNIERQKESGATLAYFGEVGKRSDFTLSVTRHSTKDGDYGVIHIYGFEDQNGNRAIWFASNDPDLELGKTYKVKATIKKHEEYQRVPQTQLSRVKVIGANL